MFTNIFTLRRQTRLHTVANVFTRGSERDCTWLQMKRRRTRSHVVANTFAQGSERDCTRLLTRSHYTLYPGGTVVAIKV